MKFKLNPTNIAVGNRAEQGELRDVGKSPYSPPILEVLDIGEKTDGKIARSPVESGPTYAPS